MEFIQFDYFREKPRCFTGRAIYPSFPLGSIQKFNRPR